MQSLTSEATQRQEEAAAVHREQRDALMLELMVSQGRYGYLPTMLVLLLPSSVHPIPSMLLSSFDLAILGYINKEMLSYSNLW